MKQQGRGHGSDPEKVVSSEAKPPDTNLTTASTQPEPPMCEQNERDQTRGTAPMERSSHEEGRFTPSSGHIRGRALVLFSGPCSAPTHLAGELCQKGFDVQAVDLLLGGDKHNLLDPEVADAYLSQIEQGLFRLVALGTPCSSYSILREPQLRSRSDPTGLLTAPADQLQELQMHNGLALFTANAILAAVKSDTPWFLENPADVGHHGNVSFWAEKANYSSIFEQPEIKAAIQSTESLPRTFAMCAFGAKARKFTTIVFGGHELCELSWPLEFRGCPHGLQGHEERLNDHNEDGIALAKLASAYPAQLCEELARYAADATARQDASRGTDIPVDVMPNNPPRRTPGHCICPVCKGPARLSCLERERQCEAVACPNKCTDPTCYCAMNDMRTGVVRVPEAPEDTQKLWVQPLVSPPWFCSICGAPGDGSTCKIYPPECSAGHCQHGCGLPQCRCLNPLPGDIATCPQQSAEVEGGNGTMPKFEITTGECGADLWARWQTFARTLAPERPVAITMEAMGGFQYEGPVQFAAPRIQDLSVFQPDGPPTVDETLEALMGFSPKPRAVGGTSPAQSDKVDVVEQQPPFNRTSQQSNDDWLKEHDERWLEAGRQALEDFSTKPVGGTSPAQCDRGDFVEHQLPFDRTPQQSDGDWRDDHWVEGGRIADGHRLHPSLSAHVDRYAQRAAGFASARILTPEDDDALLTAPLPEGLRLEVDPDKKRKRKPMGPPLPPPYSSTRGRSEREARDRRPKGPLHIEDLYYPGVYEQVSSWLAKADIAFAVLARRERGEKIAVPRLNTVVIRSLNNRSGREASFGTAATQMTANQWSDPRRRQCSQERTNSIGRLSEKWRAHSTGPIPTLSTRSAEEEPRRTRIVSSPRCSRFTTAHCWRSSQRLKLQLTGNGLRNGLTGQ